MDGDLQDPPELVPEMAERWRQGYDVVYAVRAARPGETRFKRGTASLFYRLMARLTSVDIPLDTGDFRLVDSRVVTIVANMREPDRYLRGMFAWVGFRQTSVSSSERPARPGTRSTRSRGCSASRPMGLLSFSTAPLRVTLATGFAIAGLASPRGDRDPAEGVRRFHDARLGFVDRGAQLLQRRSADGPGNDRAVRRADLRAGQAPPALSRQPHRRLQRLRTRPGLASTPLTGEQPTQRS